MDGSSHVTPKEVSIHEHNYGLGGSFLEEELFGDEMNTDYSDDEDLNPEIQQPRVS